MTAGVLFYFFFKLPSPLNLGCTVYYYQKSSGSSGTRNFLWGWLFPVFLQIEGLLFKTPAGLISSTASYKLPLQYMKVGICHQVGWKRFLLHFWPWSSHVYLVTKILQGWSLHMGGWRVRWEKKQFWGLWYFSC